MSALRQPTPPAETPSVAALAATSRETLDAIRAAYTFVDATNEAAAFGILAKRPVVAAVLLEGLPHVEAIFGEGTPILLLAIDHHTGEPLTLAARIQTSASVPEALAKQRAFFRAWWLDAGDAVLGDLTFGV